MGMILLTVQVSATQQGCQDNDKKTREIYANMIEKFGGKGHRGQGQVEHAFGFVDKEEFKNLCNEEFHKASGGDDKPLNFGEFEKTIREFLKDLLAECGDIGSGGNNEMTQDEVAAWFSKVDTNNSGAIEKDEFAEVMKFFCSMAKVATAEGYHAYLEALPKYTDFEGAPFRMGGDCITDEGSFRLTKSQYYQEGHMICTVPFETDDKEIFVKFEYMTKIKEDHKGDIGEGLCVYLMDPEKAGWDTDFDGEGPVGFQGKAGGIVGCFVDIGGEITGKKNQVAVKMCDPTLPVIKDKQIDGDDLITNGEWKKIKVKFDCEDGEVDFKIDGKKAIDDCKVGALPKKVCVGICAATGKDAKCEIRINDLKIEGKDDD